MVKILGNYLRKSSSIIMLLFADFIQGFCPQILEHLFFRTAPSDCFTVKCLLQFGFFVRVRNISNGLFFLFEQQCKNYNPEYESSHKELFFIKRWFTTRFYLITRGVLYSTTTVEKKSYFVESWGTLAKLGVLL